jgi:hypothetical protein
VLNARPAEITSVEKATGLHVPTLKELSEIESSSWLRAENGALLLEHSNSVRRRTPRPLCDTVFGGQLFHFFPIRDFLHFALRCPRFLNLPHYLRNRLNHSTARRDDSSNHLPPYIS